MNEGRRLLIVEDEPSLVLTLVDRLRAEGYEVDVAGDGEAALDATDGASYDLILLDIALPKKDGLEVCRELRAHGSSVPILMLTARSQLVDKVVGLKMGADDYLTKPFEMAELMARIEALLRRVSPSRQVEAGRVSFGDVEADFKGAVVMRAGDPVELSALELRLLRFLVEHRGEVIARDQLLEEVWGYNANVYTRTVDVHIASLRQKLEPTPKKPRHIVTVHGMGYKFVG